MGRTRIALKLGDVRVRESTFVAICKYCALASAPVDFHFHETWKRHTSTPVLMHSDRSVLPPLHLVSRSISFALGNGRTYELNSNVMFTHETKGTGNFVFDSDIYSKEVRVYTRQIQLKAALLFGIFDVNSDGRLTTSELALMLSNGLG